MQQALRLYKKEKLCSATAIDQLFSRSETDDVHGALAFPIRAVWRFNPHRHSDSHLAFLISVPKRRIRHAVDRVLVRRRIREAFRLNRPDSSVRVQPENRLDVAFIYVADTPLPYSQIERAMIKLLKLITQGS